MNAARAVATERDSSSIAGDARQQRPIVTNNTSAVHVWSAAIDGVKPPQLPSLDQKSIVEFKIKYISYVKKLDRLSIQHGHTAHPIPIKECMRDRTLRYLCAHCLPDNKRSRDPATVAAVEIHDYQSAQ